MPSAREIMSQIESQARTLTQATAEAQFWRERWLAQARQEYEQQEAASEASYQQAHRGLRPQQEQHSGHVG